MGLQGCRVGGGRTLGFGIVGSGESRSLAFRMYLGVYFRFRILHLRGQDSGVQGPALPAHMQPKCQQLLTEAKRGNKDVGCLAHAHDINSASLINFHNNAYGSASST